MIISIQSGAYYYLQTLYPRSNNSSDSCKAALPDAADHVAVFTLVNYGNGTSKWYNETRVPATWNFYDFTLFLADCKVEAQYYGAPLNEHFVTGISGVRNNYPLYWTLWAYCQKDKAWSIAKVGADLIKIVDNPVLAWYYHNPDDQQSPVPGARTLFQCS